jgi:error-prone DNA polymerase
MYAELHCHTNFSFLDGASHPADLVARARELGFSHLAITDHDGLYGIIRFCHAAREAGIKAIIGAEMTLDGAHHVTLLARNSRGYSNLCRLVSRAQLTHTKGQASLDLETLARYFADLFCLSGCRKGEVAAWLLAGDDDRALAAARKYLEVFGRENFWIELQNNLCPEDRRLCSQLPKSWVPATWLLIMFTMPGGKATASRTFWSVSGTAPFWIVPIISAAPTPNIT